MPTFRKIMASVGIGMAHLHIQLNERKHPRGSVVTGTVDLEGGIAVQHVNSVILKLKQFRPSGKTTEEKEIANWMAASSVDVLPHSRSSYSFQFFVPDDAWLNRPEGSKHPTTGCRIDAEADISFAVNPRCSLPLDVTVHREIQAVQMALRALRFSEKKAGFRLTQAAIPEQALTYYRPPEALEDQLDEVILSLQAGPDRVWGNLDLDPHETTLREKMRALVITQYQVFPLDFERSILLTPGGEPNPQAAIPRLHEILAESLVLPDNEKMRLLRPAAVPTGEVLLRPAGSARVKREELLRPVDETSKK